MSMIMNHDMTAIMGQRIMQKNTLAMKRSLEKLSTGLRTKIADVDNTAYLAIGETMRSRIFGMEKALNNSQDGISMIQTAVGALDQTQSMLSRMRELSIQAANDALTQQDRSYIQVEVNELRQEIDRIGNTTQFNRKNLLNGDNAVLWSSTDKNVKAIINGGLRSIDNYGQKYTVDGNFKISVRTAAGLGQVQKSDIFHVKHEGAVTEKEINSTLGVRDVETQGNLPSGNYTLALSQAEADTEAIFTGSFGLDANPEEVFSFEINEGMTDNASILFEVQNVNSNTGTVTLKATANILTQEGVTQRASVESLMLSEDSNGINLDQIFGENSVTVNLDNFEAVNEGAKFVVNISANTPADNAIGVDLAGVVDSTYADKWEGAPFGGQSVHYVLDGSKTGNKEINFNNFIINSKTGQVSEGGMILKTEGFFKSSEAGGLVDVNENEGTILASLTSNYVGKVATGDTSLRDIDKFWDAQGNFLLADPKEITLTQGDGTQARVMLYADDTLNSAAKKLNDAVANGLGQAKYVNDASKFVTFVNGGTTGAEAVEGTLVIRSALTGTRGEITLSGSEDILNAFSLNTIQKSSENKHSVTVRNAHTGSLVADQVEITGNRLVGVIHKNIDVEFEPMLGVNTTWDDSTGNFKFASANTEGVMLHLADNTTVIQTGAGEGEDVMLNLGDMRSHALGLDGVNVMNQEAAARSTTIIDLAQDKVSMQMAKLGASQNRLEHHIGNLTDEMQELIKANSVIRDTDYAQEMVEYTRIKILMEANSAMLAQSNAMQTQSILSLMR